MFEVKRAHLSIYTSTLEKHRIEEKARVHLESRHKMKRKLSSITNELEKRANREEKFNIDVEDTQDYMLEEIENDDISVAIYILVEYPTKKNIKDYAGQVLSLSNDEQEEKMITDI